MYYSEASSTSDAHLGFLALQTSKVWNRHNNSTILNPIQYYTTEPRLFCKLVKIIIYHII